MANRREFLSVSLAAAGLASPLSRVVACDKVPPISDGDELWKFRFGFSSAGNGDKSVRITVDPHAHIFNAQDVPVGGYFRGPLANEKLPSWLGPAADALAPWIEWWARLFAPCIEHELAEIRHLVRKAKQRASVERGAPVLQIFQEEVNLRRKQREEDFAEHFAREAPPKFRRLYERMGVARGGKVSKLSKDAVLSALHAHGTVAQRIQASGSEGNILDGVIAFVARMCGPRYENALNLIETFGPSGERNLGIDLFTPSLIDMTHWLGENTTPEKQEAQLQLSELIAVLCDGRIAPMVAFNPWMASVKPGSQSGKKPAEDVLAPVQSAVMDRGFVGVKIYPPNGYRPYGNVPRPCKNPKSFYAWPDEKFGERLNATMHELLAFCSKEEIPIMAHNGHSMGVDQCHKDRFPLSDGWKAALDLDLIKPLNAQVGHFGDEEWVNDWIGLLQDDAASARTYLDLAIETDYFTDTKNLAQSMVDRLEHTTLATKEPLYRRVLYASDWYMLLYTGLTPIYLEQMDKKLFQPIGAADARGALLGGNAIEHLGLAKKAYRRPLIDKYYKRKYTDLGMSLPQWTTLVT